jgi:WD40 repeat protein
VFFSRLLCQPCTKATNGVQARNPHACSQPPSCLHSAPPSPLLPRPPPAQWCHVFSGNGEQAFPAHCAAARGGHGGAVTSLSALQGTCGALLASAAADGSLCVWDVAGEQPRLLCAASHREAAAYVKLMSPESVVTATAAAAYVWRLEAAAGGGGAAALRLIRRVPLAAGGGGAPRMLCAAAWDNMLAAGCCECALCSHSLACILCRSDALASSRGPCGWAVPLALPTVASPTSHPSTSSPHVFPLQLSRRPHPPYLTSFSSCPPSTPLRSFPAQPTPQYLHPLRCSLAPARTHALLIPPLPPPPPTHPPTNSAADGSVRLLDLFSASVTALLRPHRAAVAALQHVPSGGLDLLVRWACVCVCVCVGGG